MKKALGYIRAVRMLCGEDRLCMLTDHLVRAVRNIETLYLCTIKWFNDDIQASHYMHTICYVLR